MKLQGHRLSSNRHKAVAKLFKHETTKMVCFPRWGLASSIVTVHASLYARSYCLAAASNSWSLNRSFPGCHFRTISIQWEDYFSQKTSIPLSFSLSASSNRFSHHPCASDPDPSQLGIRFEDSEVTSLKYQNMVLLNWYALPIFIVCMGRFTQISSRNTQNSFFPILSSPQLGRNASGMPCGPHLSFFVIVMAKFSHY